MDFQFTSVSREDKISKLKQIFRRNGYPKNFVCCCKTTNLDKVFTKRLFICNVPRRGLV